MNNTWCIPAHKLVLGPQIALNGFAYLLFHFILLLIHLHITNNLCGNGGIQLYPCSLINNCAFATERVEDKECVWHWGLKSWKG